MSDPLVEKRPGDLSALGLSSRNDLEPFEDIAERQEQEQAAQAAGEEERPPPEGEDQTQEATAEPTSEEEAPEGNILAQYYEDVKPEEESELTRLRQEKARLEGLLEGRVQSLEEQLKSPEQPSAAIPEQSESPLQSPVVRATLDSLREEDPAKYEAALVELATQQAEANVRADLDNLKSQFTEKEQQTTLEAQKAAYQRQILGAFQDVKGKGGLATQIIEDLEANRDTSLLGRKIKENPYIMLSKQGILGAVMEVEEDLRAHAEGRQSTAGQVSPKVAASAGGGVASKRGVSLDEKPNEKTYEDQVREDIRNAGMPSKRLKFMG